MRLAAQAKGGYYPTPLRVVDLLAELIDTPPAYGRPGQTLRVLDPCCGGGDALAQLADALRAPTPCPWRPTGWNCTGTGPRKPGNCWTAPWPATCSPPPSPTASSACCSSIRPMTVRRVTRHRIPGPAGRNSENVPGPTDPPRSESLGGK